MISLALSFSDSLVSFPQTTPIFTQKTHGLLSLALVGFHLLHVYIVVVYLDRSFLVLRGKREPICKYILSSVVLSIWRLIKFIPARSYCNIQYLVPSREYAFLSFKQVFTFQFGVRISFLLVYLVFVPLQTQSVLRFILLVSQYRIIRRKQPLLFLGRFLYSCVPKFS